MTAAPSPYLVPFDGSFVIGRASTTPPRGAPRKKKAEQALEREVARIDALQEKLYADNRHAVLLIFQAMDAAGKDGTIRAVLTGTNPIGFQIYSFKRPSHEELDHDFLWRTACRLPERGRIGVFNRSYYEEVLVVRVHPELLAAQNLPPYGAGFERIWQERYGSIRDHELHLTRNGTIILKFWLNVSKEEQRRRFLARLDEPEKNWKFEAGDVRERGHWNAYQSAYAEALAETSRPWAPWYAVPADDKAYMRLQVADIVVKTLESLDLRYPRVLEAERERFAEMRSLLVGEGAAPSRKKTNKKAKRSGP
ncbi:MAG TPA: PPK2 family polyphosphate kinase [Thermoanaerobaculia bacterium]|nr:PPK2 family polyphosphate kinase [Thermoanaerobaculia bacterium]